MRERGFVLIEVLIAATIVIVAISGLAQLFVVSSAAGQRARLRTVATLLAGAKMEELRASPEAVVPGVDYPDALGNNVGRAAAGALYVRRWSVVDMPSDSNAQVLEVVVTLPRASPGEVVRLAALKTARTP